jgi:hypothetical protein
MSGIISLILGYKILLLTYITPPITRNDKGIKKTDRDTNINKLFSRIPREQP